MLIEFPLLLEFFKGDKSNKVIKIKVRSSKVAKFVPTYLFEIICNHCYSVFIPGLLVACSAQCGKAL